jgi:hypothetical protein
VESGLRCIRSTFIRTSHFRSRRLRCPKPKDRSIECTRCFHWVEVFTKERNLAAYRTQEQNILLHSLRRLPIRIGEGMYSEVEEAEIFYRSHEPGHMSYHFFSP